MRRHRERTATSPRSLEAGQAPPRGPGPRPGPGGALPLRPLRLRGAVGRPAPCLPGLQQTRALRGVRARNTGEGGAPKGTHGPLCSPDLGALPLGSSVAHVASRARGRRGSSKASVTGDALPLERQPGHWGTWALGGAQSSHLEGRRGARPGPDLRLTHRQLRGAPPRKPPEGKLSPQRR